MGSLGERKFSHALAQWGRSPAGPESSRAGAHSGGGSAGWEFGEARGRPGRARVSTRRWWNDGARCRAVVRAPRFACGSCGAVASEGSRQGATWHPSILDITRCESRGPPRRDRLSGCFFGRLPGGLRPCCSSAFLGEDPINSTWTRRPRRADGSFADRAIFVECRRRTPGSVDPRMPRRHTGAASVSRASNACGRWPLIGQVRSPPSGPRCPRRM